MSWPIRVNDFERDITFLCIDLCHRVHFHMARFLEFRRLEKVLFLQNKSTTSK